MLCRKRGYHGYRLNKSQINSHTSGVIMEYHSQRWNSRVNKLVILRLPLRSFIFFSLFINYAKLTWKVGDTCRLRQEYSTLYIILIEVSFDHRTGPQTLCHLFGQHRLQVLLQLSITYCWFLQCLVQYLHHRLLSTQVLPIKGGKYDYLEVNG